MNPYRDHIETYAGHAVNPLDPDPATIDTVDIVHALSRICRFTGHTRHYYSVAAHSLTVASLVEPEHRLWALLHDASEAYLCDLARPLKRVMPDYARAEERLLRVIVEKFGLGWPMPEAVRQADDLALVAEAREFMPCNEPPWDFSKLPVPPEGIELHQGPVEVIEVMYGLALRWELDRREEA
jgi:hypothetical protein